VVVVEDVSDRVQVEVWDAAIYEHPSWPTKFSHFYPKPSHSAYLDFPVRSSATKRSSSLALMIEVRDGMVGNNGASTPTTAEPRQGSGTEFTEPLGLLQRHANGMI
jgi:hypothetical protein